MYPYTLNVYEDMHLTYGVMRESSRTAAQMYAVCYPNRRKPQLPMFARVLQQLKKDAIVIHSVSVTLLNAKHHTVEQYLVC